MSYLRALSVVVDEDDDNDDDNDDADDDDADAAAAAAAVLVLVFSALTVGFLTAYCRRNELVAACLQSNESGRSCMAALRNNACGVVGIPLGDACLD